MLSAMSVLQFPTFGRYIPGSNACRCRGAGPVLPYPSPPRHKAAPFKYLDFRTRALPSPPPRPIHVTATEDNAKGTINNVQIPIRAFCVPSVPHPEAEAGEDPTGPLCAPPGKKPISFRSDPIALRGMYGGGPGPSQ
jgi:hypothetical protein